VDPSPWLTSRKVDFPLTEELQLRVQALESLIRSGLTIDPDQASLMAAETIQQATKAAQSGSKDATNALAQLSRSAMNVGGMTQDAQSSLLLDVLQQLSGTTKQEHSGEGGVWAGVPIAIPLGCVTIGGPS
jgi:hypothetical protein